MGGNTRAINRETGEVIAYAGKVDLREIPRIEFKKILIELFLTLNQLAITKLKTPIWKNDYVLISGQAINGSSSYIFDESVSDEDLLKYKSIFGDIDITIPNEMLQPLFNLLTELEGLAITKRVTYIGQNKRNSAGLQINALFNLDDKINFQIDFEGSEYIKDAPSDFAKFAHSANWEDIKRGFKGVGHKYILINLVRSASVDKNACILTPASSTDPADKKFRLKTMHEDPKMKAFSVDKGLREKYKQIVNGKNPLIFQGKLVYKELPTADSTYVTDISQIFNHIFGHIPTQEELDAFNSFTGIVYLMKKHIKKENVIGMFDYLINDSLFGKNSQQLSREEWKEDMGVKFGIINHLFKEFPYLVEKADEVKQMAKDFYKTYGKTK